MILKSKILIERKKTISKKTLAVNQSQRILEPLMGVTDCTSSFAEEITLFY
jgi:hypothetical protein